MNEDIRRAIRIADVRHWQIAARIGIHENTLVRWLRAELSEAHKKAILSAIEALSQGGE